MFSITFEDEVYTRWSDDYLFKSREEAKEYLVKQGFVEKNRLFYREDYNWSKYLKAYINPMKIF